MSQDDRRSDLAVMDAQEFKQKRRLRSLLEAREKVESKDDDAEELYVRGHIDKDARNTIVFRAVKEYIREGWPLLLEHARKQDKDANSEYFATRDLGSFEIAGKTVKFQGLIDILHSPAIYTEEYEAVETYPHGPDETVEKTEQRSVPIDISWYAYLTMTEFLADVHDLEIQFEAIDDTLESFGFESLDLSEAGIKTIEEIRETYSGGIDARAMDGDVEVADE